MAFFCSLTLGLIHNVVPVFESSRWWEIWLVVLVGYSAWVSPFEFGFIQNPRGALLAVDYTVDAFFAIDIILTFFVAYLDKRTFVMVDDLRKIAFR